MCLQFLFGNCRFFDSSLEGAVDERKLAPHVVGTLSQAEVNVCANLLRDLALLTRSFYVLLRELHPTHGVRDSEHRTNKQLMCAVDVRDIFSR